jgi:hypothetical protein
MSNESLTEKINNANVASVRKQIEMKQGCNPHYGTINGANSVVTDLDHHPYTRFYRGVPSSADPIVFEREAGWRPQRDDCYNVNGNCYTDSYPNHCFEGPCSTTYPCNTSSINKDIDALNVQLNRSCIAMYR